MQWMIAAIALLLTMMIAVLSWELVEAPLLTQRSKYAGEYLAGSRITCPTQQRETPLL
jgi:peptidoglycan/LPS O-acetylase OafA/YrhL